MVWCSLPHYIYSRIFLLSLTTWSVILLENMTQQFKIRIVKLSLHRIENQLKTLYVFTCIYTVVRVLSPSNILVHPICQEIVAILERWPLAIGRSECINSSSTKNFWPH